MDDIIELYFPNGIPSADGYNVWVRFYWLLGQGAPISKPLAANNRVRISMSELEQCPGAPCLMMDVVREDSPDGGPTYTLQRLGQAGSIMKPGKVSLTFRKTVLRDQNGQYVEAFDGFLQIPHVKDLELRGYKTLIFDPNALDTIIGKYLPLAELEAQEVNAIHEELGKRIRNESLYNYFLPEFTSVLAVLAMACFAELGVKNAAPNREFVRYLFEVAGRMHGWDHKELNRFLLKPSDQPDTMYKALVVYGEAIMLMGTCCYYAADMDRGEMVERMMSCTLALMGQADCEDMAAEIHRMANALKYQYADEDDDIQGFIELAKHYEYGLVTGAATSPDLREDSGRNVNAGQPEDYICHIWTIGIPNDIFERWTGERAIHTTRGPLADLVNTFKVQIYEGTSWARSIYLPVQRLTSRRLQSTLRAEQEAAIRLKNTYLKGITTFLSEIRCDVDMQPVLEDPKTQSMFYYLAISMARTTNWGQDEGRLTEYHWETSDGQVGAYLQELVEARDTISLKTTYEFERTTREQRVMLMGGESVRDVLSTKHVDPKLEDRIVRELGLPSNKRGRKTGVTVDLRFLDVSQVGDKARAGLRKMIEDPEVRGYDVVTAQIAKMPERGDLLKVITILLYIDTRQIQK